MVTRIAVALTLALVSAAAFAQEARGPLRITATLEKSAVMLGEPIVLRFRFSAPEVATPIGGDLGKHARRWARVDLLDGQGKPVPPVPTYERRPAIEGGVTPGMRVEPGEVVELVWVVEPDCVPPVPGEYILRVRIDLPINEAPAQYARRHTDELRLPLRVTKADRTALRRLAESLAERYLAYGVTSWDGGEHNHLRERITALPGKVASPIWRALLLRAQSTDLGMLAMQLKRLGTREAIDVLADGISAGSEQVRVMARHELADVCYRGDPALRAYATRLYAERTGGPLPPDPLAGLIEVDLD